MYIKMWAQAMSKRNRTSHNILTSKIEIFHTFYRPGHSIWGAKEMALQVILITNKKQMRVKNSNLLS